jgi:hypothetical protein
VAIDLTKIPPIVEKKWLYLLAGSIWCLVGLFLIRLALGWFVVLSSQMEILYILLGITIGIPYVLMFLIVAKRNIDRLQTMPEEKLSLFNFQPWYSYLIVIIMMSLGITLRLYSPFLKTDLGILNMGIGVSISVASLKFLKMFFVG